MKNRILLAFTLAFTQILFLNAQCPNVLQLGNQDLIDHFSTYFPQCASGTPYDITIVEFNNQPGSITNLNGLSSITHIGGDLTIGFLRNLTSLEGLGSLTSVGGTLSISGNPGLTNLQGLGSLTSVGSVVIGGNANLTNFTGLGSLTSISGDFSIAGNANLTSLTGLNALTTIGASTVANGLGLSIGGSNPSLTSLTGLDRVTYIGNLNINDNTALHDLTGLGKVATIPGRFYIQGGALTSLSGLNMLTTIGGDVYIRETSTLTSLTGMNNVTSIGGFVTLFDNSALTSLSGLGALTSVGAYLHITRNPILASVSDLSHLTSIGGSLGIVQNYVLTSLSGLDNINPTTITNLSILNSNQLSLCNVPSICNYLAAVPAKPATISNNAFECSTRDQVRIECACLGSVTLSSQAQINAFPVTHAGCTNIENITIQETTPGNITNLNGLSQLRTISGEVRIVNNTLLTNLTGLGGVTSIGDNFIIYSPYLTSLTGLGGLTSIGGTLTIENTSLTSLSSLGALTSIGGDFNFRYNTALQNFTGLTALNTIGRNLDVSNNTVLTSLMGLNTLTAVNRQLYITNNVDLTSLSGLNALTTIGSITLEGNSALTDLSALNHTIAITDNYVSIIGNSQLSNCSIVPICSYLNASSTPNAYISNNSPSGNCNSVAYTKSVCNNPLLQHITTIPSLPYTNQALDCNTTSLANTQSFMPSGFNWDSKEAVLKYVNTTGQDLIIYVYIKNGQSNIAVVPVIGENNLLPGGDNAGAGYVNGGTNGSVNFTYRFLLPATKTVFLIVEIGRASCRERV